jgi:Universal stress protein UspA and related nucleotide-binding proteins
MKTEVREALPVPAIFAAIQEHQPDLVVMGTHGRGGLSRLLYGSVTEAVLRSAKVPVLTINHAVAPRMPRGVLCLATADAEGDSAQRVSVELAARVKASCRVLAVKRGTMAEALSSPEGVAADLIVIADEVHTVTRHAACPVLHVPAGFSG